MALIPAEGHGDKFIGPGVEIGAGVGALGFLAAPCRTVYKSHELTVAVGLCHAG